MRVGLLGSFIPLCLIGLSGCVFFAPARTGPDWSKEIAQLNAIPPLVLNEDPDGDGIVNEKDGAPLEAEDSDGYEDDDGIPDPVHVDDVAAAEPASEDEEETADAPTAREPSSEESGAAAGTQAVAKAVDVDDDGVIDAYDLCLMVPEDLDGFEDGDGCPEEDNDGDEIPDRSDPCPLVWGKECPRMLDVQNQFVFASGSARLDVRRSRKALREVLKELGKGQIKRVEIRGYTDGLGRPKVNLRLSKQRAQAVKDYLVDQGIADDSVVVQGMGIKDPVASDETPEGRALNRRVEFVVLE